MFNVKLKQIISSDSHVNISPSYDTHWRQHFALCYTILGIRTMPSVKEIQLKVKSSGNTADPLNAIRRHHHRFHGFF